MEILTTFSKISINAGIDAFESDRKYPFSTFESDIKIIAIEIILKEVIDLISFNM